MKTSYVVNKVFEGRDYRTEKTKNDVGGYTINHYEYQNNEWLFLGKEEIKEKCKKRTLESRFFYGMRLRGFSMGCQPMRGLIDHIKDSKYYDVLIYNRKLTAQELKDYELDFIKKI